MLATDKKEIAMDARKYFRTMNIGLSLVLVGFMLLIFRVGELVKTEAWVSYAFTMLGFLVFASSALTGIAALRRETERRRLAPEEPDLAPWADSEPDSKPSERKLSDAELIVRQISDELDD